MNREVAARLAVLILIVSAVVACVVPASTAAPAPTRSAVPAGSLASASPPAPSAIDPASGLPIVSLADLPPEAAATVALIDAGGPFPYAQDGAVFQNRERSLPIRRSGYYHEYTVESPGSDDRGPWRIVAGANGEMYWTADHYDSFAWIAR